MVLTEKERKDFEAVARPLIRWLGENHLPYLELIEEWVSYEVHVQIFYVRKPDAS